MFVATPFCLQQATTGAVNPTAVGPGHAALLKHPSLAVSTAQQAAMNAYTMAAARAYGIQAAPQQAGAAVAYPPGAAIPAG